MKILFAPHEIGGQMQLMAEELRRRGHFATAASYSQEWVGHVNDVNLNIDRTKGRLRRQINLTLFALWAAQNYDIFHFFWGESLFGLGRFPRLDLPLLRQVGKKILVHFRGLDIIDLEYFDYLRGKMAGDEVSEPPISRSDQVHSMKQWRRYAHRLLISEPDLTRVAPEAVLVQQAIDLSRWQPERGATSSGKDGVIRVVHAPTMRRKKGTEFVERSIAELQAQGYPVELVLIEKMPFHQVKAIYETADIGVDQVLYGWYGKVSIELMALGKPVICFIDPQWLPYRPDMPIVNADPGNLTAKVAELVTDAQLRRSLALAGRDYVQKYHAVEKIIDQCLEIYQEASR